MSVLAQVSEGRIEQVCGPADERRWLCEWVLETTESEALAAFAGGADLLLRVALVVVLAVVATWLARRLVRRFGRRMERRIHERLERAEARGTLQRAEQYRDRRVQRLQAITGAMQGGAGATIWLVAILAVIAEFGIALSAVLAGAGLIGIVLGFGAQQLVRDVLAGIAMLVEDQYGVGDWIEVDGKIGQVERVGLRATSFRDLDGVQWHVLNGYIQRVGNYSQQWGRMTFDIPMALDTDVPAAKALISKVAHELAEDPVWGNDIIGPPEIWGVQEFGPEGLAIRCVIPTRPMANWDIKRQMRERINHAFAQAGIRQPGALTDLGGRPDAFHPVRHASQPDEARPRPRRGGLVPPDAPLEPRTGADRTAEDEAVRARDETTELRITRGFQPRPD